MASRAIPHPACRYGSARSAMDSRAEAVAFPAPCAACCTPLAAERAPRATTVRPACAARAAATLARDLAARRALTSTRLAAVLTVARRARLRLAVTAVELGADRRRLAPDARAVTRLLPIFFAAALRG